MFKSQNFSSENSLARLKYHLIINCLLFNQIEPGSIRTGFKFGNILLYDLLTIRKYPTYPLLELDGSLYLTHQAIIKMHATLTASTYGESSLIYWLENTNLFTLTAAVEFELEIELEKLTLREMGEIYIETLVV